MPWKRWNLLESERPGKISQLTTLFSAMRLNVERISMIENERVTTDIISPNSNKRRIKILPVTLTVFQRLFPAYVPIFVMRIMKQVSLNSSKGKSKWSERWRFFHRKQCEGIERKIRDTSQRSLANNIGAAFYVVASNTFRKGIPKSLLLQRQGVAMLKVLFFTQSAIMWHTYAMQASVWSEKAICYGKDEIGREKLLFYVLHLNISLLKHIFNVMHG